MTRKAPFTSEPTELLKLQHRVFATRGLEFMADGSFFVRDYKRNRKWVRTFYVSSHGGAKEIDSRSLQNRYKDLGAIVEALDAKGQRLVRQDGDFIYYSGIGASPTGDHPFLDQTKVQNF